MTSAADRPAAGEAASRERAFAVAGILAAMVLFSGNFVLARRGLLAGIEAVDLVALRYGVAGLLLLPVLAAASARRTLVRLGAVKIAVLSLLGGAPYFGATSVALMVAPAGHAVVLNPGATTMFAIALAAFSGDRLGRSAVLGVPMMLCGLALVAGDGLAARPDMPHAWAGDILLIASGAAWAAFGTLMRRWGVDALTATAAVCVVSLVAVLPPYLAFAGLRLADAPLGEVVLQGVYQGLLVGAVAVLLYARAVNILGVSRAALFPPLVPAMGTALAAALLGEAVTAWQVAGMTLTVAGMVVCAFRGRPRSPPTG